MAIQSSIIDIPNQAQNAGAFSLNARVNAATQPRKP